MAEKLPENGTSRRDTTPGMVSAMTERWQYDGRGPTAANLLTAIRLIAAPIMVWLALEGEQKLFLWLLTISFITDAADGTVARLYGGPTAFGAKFDSVADAVAYTAIGLSVLLLWPEVVRQELPAVIVLVVSLVLPAMVGFWKYGQLTSYHTRLVKMAVGAVAIGLMLLLCGFSAWPFRIAAVLAGLSAIEAVGITLLLREPKSDIRGIFAAWRSCRPS
ncbi:MAG: CDP-alcohol phosphatidyltransferase family protein [Hyphomicrobiaceae bacterium]